MGLCLVMLEMSESAYVAVLGYISGKQNLNRIGDCKNKESAVFSVNGFSDIGIRFTRKLNTYKGGISGFLNLYFLGTSPIGANFSNIQCYNSFQGDWSTGGAEFVVPCPSNFDKLGIDGKHASVLQMKAAIDTAIDQWPFFLHSLEAISDFKHRVCFLISGARENPALISYRLEVKSSTVGRLSSLFGSTYQLTIFTEDIKPGSIKLAIVEEGDTGNTILKSKIISTDSFQDEMRKFLFSKGELNSCCCHNIERCVDRMIRLCD